MDLGATLCSRTIPRCESCPINSKCGAFKENDIETYPGKKPKKIKPIRSTRFFIFYNDSGGILIEQRKSKGVWQGLWGALQRETKTDPNEVLSELGISPQKILSIEFGDNFRHTFSHYHLDIEPVFVSMKHEIDKFESTSVIGTSLESLLNKQELGISRADQLVFESLNKPAEKWIVGS